MAPIHPVPFGPMHHVAHPLGGQPPRPFVGTVLFASNKGTWRKIVLIPMELNLELIKQKEEDQKGMAKAVRLLLC